MIMARKIVEKGPSEARAFSAISRAVISIIPNKRNINYIIIHYHRYLPNYDIEESI